MNTEDERFDDFLRDMMQESGLEKAPPAFTMAVMGHIAAETAKAKRITKPFISLRGWIGIAASVVATCIAAIMTLQPSKRELPGQQQVASAVEGFNGLFANLQFPLVLVMSLMAIALLFGLDQYLSRRKNISL
jgi:NADH:ubiquinone oxidoreductase subunit 6 (subunit J)